MAERADDAGPDDRLLRHVVAGVESETGEAFLRALVRELAAALGVSHAFVSELTRGGSHFRAAAVWASGRTGETFEVPLAGTPCETVLGGRLVHHPDRLQQRYPTDTGLAEWGVESYAGVPLVDARGVVRGHLAVLDRRPMPSGARAISVMRIFASRAVAELERERALEELRASERRLESIVKRAADGIIVTEPDGTIVVFNPGAERILRCPASEALGTSVYRFGTEEGSAARREVQRQLDRDPTQLFFYGEEAGVLAKRADGSLFLHEGSLARSDVGDRVLYTIIFRDCEERRAASREIDELRRQNAYLREEVDAARDPEEIVGRSPALREAMRLVELVSGSDATVLLLGETGSGKEIFARAIHARSARRAKPLVRVNCAALAPGLIESELFGHERGAFTGATTQRMGRFELADGGTIFLDEVGEIPPETQAKLLRVLQEHEFERVGGTETLRTDVRVLAATNRDLEAAVASGAFREDLFYRLNVFPLRLPPLRERHEDVALLAHFFLSRHAPRTGRRIDRIGDTTIARLAAYPWPGNVRELENVIERAVILSRGPELEVAPGLLPDLPRRAPAASRSPEPPPVGASLRPLEEVEREHIVATLRGAAWRIEGPDGAAARLGLHPSTLRSRIKKLGIVRSRDTAP